ncbi:hypothetical protein K461DRAFT_269747 [Myriangium duriaei CBS 260.36]|uniref:Uncharacterized protein n=1 Tax=Myriangium duriaei CBS 260.36 TaxID=1168546 RepID=A0A9P4ML97_9PEZI|nr:hypothetical protein K461DRAFT_269747 [Myriangium duriaei CBS 260.36]
MASSIPPIVFDTTLQDLYHHEGTPENLMLVFASPGTMKSCPTFPEKFCYHSPGCPFEDGEILVREDTQLISQMSNFMAGKIPVIMFDLDPDVNERQRQERTNVDFPRPHQADAYRTSSSICPQQRPDLQFVSAPSEIKTQPGQCIAVKFPMDSLCAFPHLVDAETHFSLLSKRNLSLSSLPTPPTKIIDTSITPEETKDEGLVNIETGRLLSCAREHDLPFVLKMSQSAAGYGTFTV